MSERGAYQLQQRMGGDLAVTLRTAEIAYWRKLLRRLGPKASSRELAKLAGVSAATAWRRMTVLGFTPKPAATVTTWEIP